MHQHRVGPSLKYGGADVVAGQFGGWTAIGAEATATGYQVAWKVTGADQYMVWNTDSSGKYLSNAVGVFVGSSTALQSLETSFPSGLEWRWGNRRLSRTVIEARGSTSLTAVGNFFDSISTGSGPSLKYGGVDVVRASLVAGRRSAPKQTASGYQVAWKLPGADQYIVWNTDSSGN